MRDTPRQESGRPAALSSERHSGVVTLLFTDVAGSTALKQQLGDKAGLELLKRHHDLLRKALTRFPGAREINTAGDSFFISFPTPSAAVSFGLLLQKSLSQFNAQCATPVQDRVGIHLGEVALEGGEQPVDLHGLSVDLCARVMSLAQAGQILMTRPVFDNARQSLKGEEVEGVSGLEWLSHGRFELKGLEEPVEVCEVRSAGVANLSPPTTSDKARRVESAEGEAVLGWRPAIGQVVPNTKWVLQEKLGEGGFGEVWKARHEKLSAYRVFKFCFRADRVRSLKREVTLFRLLKERIGEHPNIVRLYDIFFDEPPYYLEEEYVAGKDLRSWCEAQGGVERVPLAQRLEIMAQVADALQAAHDAGVIHRDVKPGNILVGGQRPEVRGQGSNSQPSTLNSQLLVKLTDFGIGQVVSEEALAGVTRAGFTQTVAGSVSSSPTGTHLYMAPELLEGKPASIRSDVYSLGVVLYQTLVGDFGRSVTTDWTKQVSDPLLREDLQHCFAGNPEERFTGAGQLARLLRSRGQRREELMAKERAQRQAALRHRAALVSAVAAGLFLLLAVALGFGLRKATQQRRIADNAREIQRRYAYAADMKAAQVALRQNNRGMATHLLSRYLPRQGEEDLRGLEWRYLWQMSRGDELQTFQHPAMVKGAALSPDGRQIATAALDGKLRVWDVASGKELHQFDGATQLGFKSVSFSPDGKWLAAPSPDGVQVRETSRWGLVTNLEPQANLVSFSPDGRHLAALGRDARYWALADWSHSDLTNVLADHSNLAFTPDGSQLLFSISAEGRNGPIQFWALGTGALTALGGSGYRSLAVSPDGRWLASGNMRGEVHLWDLSLRKVATTFRAHRGLVYTLDFSPDSRLLATGGNDQLIHFWEAGTSNKVRTLQGHAKEIWSLSFSRDGQNLISASEDKTVKLWRVKPSFTREYRWSAGTNPIPIGLFPDESVLVTVDLREKLTYFWGVPEGRPAGSFEQRKFEQEGWDVFRFFPENRVALGVSTNGLLLFWDLQTRAPRRSISLNLSNAVPQRLSRDNRWLVGTSPWGYVLYDLRNPLWMRVLPAYWQQADACFSADTRWLAYSTTNYDIKLWDLIARREHATLTGAHGWPVTALGFSPAGDFLASGSMDAEIRLWSLATGKPLFPALQGHQSGIYAVAFSSDSKTLISGADDGSVRMWSAATGQEMLMFEDVRMVRHPGWSMGEKLLFLQERDGTALVTPLPSLAEIDAIKRSRSKAP